VPVADPTVPALAVESVSVMKIPAVIPAHNEARVIAATVGQTLRAVVPNPVFVVADRCDDATAPMARVAGARVLERQAGPSGKGAAIAWFLEQPESQDAEALLILDADSRLHADALAFLARALASGADAAQGFVFPVFDEHASTVSLAAYNEWLSQAIDDRIRARLGWPVRLRGTGMVVRCEVLRELAPRLRTRVEDAELTLLLLAGRKRIVFAPKAVVDDPKPHGVEALARQRARWLQGDWEIWRSYRSTVGRLLLTFNLGAWWLLSTLLLKPRTLVALAKIAVLGLLWPLRAYLVPRVAFTLIVLSLLFVAAYSLLGLAIVPRPWRRPLVRSMIRAPLYVFMWVRALLWSLRSREPWMRARD